MMHSSEAQRILGIAHPILQGPFGGGLSTIRLVTAVSNRGGLGSYGAHVVAPEDIEKLAAEIREGTEKPFALNLWVSDHDPGGDVVDDATCDRAWPIFEPYFRELGLDRPEPPRRFHHSYEQQVEALLEARPPVFSFVFGIPSERVLAECRRLGIVTIGAATSIREAEALEHAKVDLIVATGAEAGGHRPSFLAPAEDSLCGTFALTQLVSSRVAIPVIAAGGIANGNGVRAVQNLGGQAAQIGTAFLACEESGASPEHRNLLFSDRALQTTLTRAFSGRLARGMRNRWTEEFRERTDLPPFPITSWFTSELKRGALAAGRTDLVSLWSGQIAPNLRHRTVDDLMTSILERL